jgi:hypothetical protein
LGQVTVSISDLENAVGGRQLSEYEIELKISLDSIPNIDLRVVFFFQSSFTPVQIRAALVATLPS